MIDFMEHLVNELDTMVTAPDLEVAKSLRGKKVPKGSSYGEELLKALYAKAAEEKRPMPDLTPEMAGQFGGEVFVFPNLLILPSFGNVMIYRIRPNGLNPDSAIFEVRGTRGVSPGTKVPRSQPQFVSDPTDPAQLALIPRQDFGNVPRVQKGLHSLANKQVWLGKEHEKIIRNMHQELDRYMQGQK